MVAQAKILFLCLAVFCVCSFASLPRGSERSEKPHQGGESFALALHQGLAAANVLIAAGLFECWCDEGRRSRSTGKERDAETGLDYLGARYMSAAQGRFTSADEPLIDQDESDPQSWNLYSYVRDNPLRFTDPTGRKCVQTNNGWGDDGTRSGSHKAGVDAEGNITAQKFDVKGQQGNVVAALALNTFFALDSAANAWFSPIFGLTSYLQDIPTSSNWTGCAGQAGVFLIPGPGGESSVAGRVGIWSETKGLSCVQNAFSHWTRHRKEFSSLQNASSTLMQVGTSSRIRRPSFLRQIRFLTTWKPCVC